MFIRIEKKEEKKCAYNTEKIFWLFTLLSGCVMVAAGLIVIVKNAAVVSCIIPLFFPLSASYISQCARLYMCRLNFVVVFDIVCLRFSFIYSTPYSHECSSFSEFSFIIHIRRHKKIHRHIETVSTACVRHLICYR